LTTFVVNHHTTGVVQIVSNRQKISEKNFLVRIAIIAT
jgi:hypothetical protein